MSPQHEAFEPIKLVEIIAEEVGTPREDGSPGSALYSVPIRISSTPPSEWASLFVRCWDNPPRFTTMHRPGIASVRGDAVVLNGTTLEEVEQYHRETLTIVVDQTKKMYLDYEKARIERVAREDKRIKQHRESVEEKSRKIKF